MNRTLEHILPRVQKPARYTGGEYNAVVKDRRAVDVRYALCFPDTYEIGMSNLGVRILYGLMNEMDGVWCERVFAPWGDMEEEMRREGIPLYGLESGDSIADFDLIGFSLGYEMAYTNVLNMLDLAGLPLRSGERTELSPIVVAGGTCAFNPEPLAPFVDLFVLGEGEDVSVEIIQLYRQAREEGWGKEEFLTAAARIPGVYVPSLYEVSYHGDGTVAAVTPLEGAPARVTKRIVQDFDKSYFPVKTIVPSTEIVHDRVMLEVFRGCIRGCRFCQAGYAYRPVRPRNPQRLVQQGIEACRDSGYQEMTLSSLSTSDYRALEGLCDGLLEWCEPNKVSLSLPSLRADNFSLGLMERVQQREALFHAGPAHRDRRGCAGHRRAGREGIQGVEGVHPQPQAGGDHHRVHRLLCTQAPHRLPVGGPGEHGGVPAAGQAAAGQHAGAFHPLQLARSGHQFPGGSVLTGGPPGGRRD